MMSKPRVRNRWFFSTARWWCCKCFLAKNFAKDASKAGQEYADEGLKQGQKLGEDAFEFGKDKGNIHFFLWRWKTICLYFTSLANEALKAAKKAGKIWYLSFIDHTISSCIGSDAYEATLEYGADGVKKARKLRKSIQLFLFDEM